MAVIEVHRALDRARDLHHEDKDGAEAEAIRCHEIARTLDDPALRGRALVLQAAIALQRGDLHGAVELISEAEPHAREDAVRSELAAVKGQLNFFAGSYAESLAQAERAIELADRLGTLELRLFARRQACVVFGNIGVSDWHARLHEVLQLAIEAGNPWEEAMSRNDLAHYTMEQGDLEGAEAQIGAAMAAAAPLAPHNRFALAVLGCTRSEVRLRAGRAGEALEDAQRVDRAADPQRRPEPLPAGDDRGGRGPGAAGARPPRRGRALRAARGGAARRARPAGAQHDPQHRRRGPSRGRPRPRGLPRPHAERRGRAAPPSRSSPRCSAGSSARRTRPARRAARATRWPPRTASSSRWCASSARRRAALEQQADRDYLTGLHNRRYLARELDRHAPAPDAGPFSLAVLDLDHFKEVNDRFGHEAGDQVLMRVAALLLGGVRGQDVVVRTGGEEFVLLMPQTDASAAEACCERVRHAIRDEPWDAIVPGLSLTVSAGVATADDASDLQTLAELADRRLYMAKRTGRDRVVV